MSLFKSAAVLFCLQLLAVGASAQAEAFASAGDVSALAGAGIANFDTTYVQPITSAFADANPYNAAAAIATALGNNQAASILQAFTQVCRPHSPCYCKIMASFDCTYLVSILWFLCRLCLGLPVAQAATACATIQAGAGCAAGQVVQRPGCPGLRLLQLFSEDQSGSSTGMCRGHSKYLWRQYMQQSLIGLHLSPDLNLRRWGRSRCFCWQVER